MRPFELLAPETVEDAVGSSGTFLAGGTTLVDLMKLNVLTPQQVLDINAVPLRGIDTTDGLRFGALERMADIAGQPLPGTRRLHGMATSRKYEQRVRCMRLPPMLAMLRNCAEAPASRA